MVGLDIKDKKFGYLTPIELIPEDSRTNSYQFLTLYENLAKRDMTQTEWGNFKRVNHCYSDLFIGGDA